MNFFTASLTYPTAMKRAQGRLLKRYPNVYRTPFVLPCNPPTVPPVPGVPNVQANAVAASASSVRAAARSVRYFGSLITIGVAGKCGVSFLFPEGVLILTGVLLGSLLLHRLAGAYLLVRAARAHALPLEVALDIAAVERVGTDPPPFEGAA